MISSKPFKLMETSVFPGEKAKLALPMPERFSCSPLILPFTVINGKSTGPVSIVFSGVVGNELSTIEGINKLTESIEASDVSGTIICVPILNVLGLTSPNQESDLVGSLLQSLPGDANGNYVERVANIIYENLIKKCDCCLFIRTGDPFHKALPVSYYDLENREMKEIADNLNSPVTSHFIDEDNIFSRTMEELKVKLMILECGEANKLEQDYVDWSYHSTREFLSSVGILSKQSLGEAQNKPLPIRNENWVISPVAGFFKCYVSLGDRVVKGQTVAGVSDPFDSSKIIDIKSPHDGIVICINSKPLVHEGLSLVRVASFLNIDVATEHLENWEEESY